MRVAPEIIADLCRARARDLMLPAPKSATDVDPLKLLWGLAGVESAFGANCNPRHEVGYCYSGRYFDYAATAEWGCLAHCSYGPWQVMFNNFPKGLSVFALLPQGEGTMAADISIRGAISVLNRAIGRGARSLTDIVMAYNGRGDVDGYLRRLNASLESPMPQYRDPVTA